MNWINCIHYYSTTITTTTTTNNNNNTSATTTTTTRFQDEIELVNTNISIKPKTNI